MQSIHIKTVLRNKEEKVAQHLNARFIYEGDDSSENKLNTAFEKGEISTDDYVLQMAYSLYEPDKLAPSYQSNNAVALAPDIAGLFCEHIDELSDETAEYIARKIMLTDVRIHPDASQNPVAPKQGWLPFVTHAYADGYDVTVLDRACLSPNGKFLIWYTLTG